MKTALLLTALLPTLFLLTSQRAHALDFRGVDTREIPIPMSRYQEAKRAEVLRQPTITESEWMSLTDQQKITVLMSVRAIQEAQADYIADEAAIEREEDAEANPQAQCSKNFGPGYRYGGNANQDEPDGTEERFYICTKFGPSQRTPYEKRIIELNGFVQMVRFKARHPLTEWPG